MLKSVLLVEDEMFVGIELQISFEEDGWEVDGPYATAAQAVAALKTDKPACAVLDVGLIDADVFVAAERLTALDIPFLFYTGQPNIDELGVRFPDAPTITKPALPSYVIEAAHGLVSQRSSL